MAPEFDIIFAGGEFSSESLIRAPTHAAPPKILLVESGQHTCDLPHHVQPCRWPTAHLAPDSTTVALHVARPSPHLDGRAAVVPCGRSVGGGSTVNYMMYVRGAASDYDGWEALGNDGWGFDRVLPLIRKLETFTPVSDRSTHGYSGPVQISAGTGLGIGSQFLDVARQYDPARPLVDDNNDFKTANAYSLTFTGQRYVDPVTGKRADAASRYLYTHAGNPNITIVVGKRVKRVIIENGRAVGIEYTSDVVSCQEASDERVTVRATKLVVVSAGAFGSPAILERSGVGEPSVLEKNDVPVLVDLPGVGENYQDHLGARPAFYASDETETMDDVWSDPQAIAARLQEWEENGTGKIAHNGIEAFVKVRPTAAQLTFAEPALQRRWETFFQHCPDKPMGIILPFSGVHITSGEDANSPLDFDPRYCSKPGDVAQLTMLYKMTRELVRRMPAYRGEVAAYHPKFPLGSPAVCGETDGPVPIDEPDIVYSDADDEAIAIFNRATAATTKHSLGTCAMKPRDQGGVVDARLNVYGVEWPQNMSICPTNVGNNTYFTALLIGEKAAAMIAEELGVTLE
ncbi:GMC oxidoreductase-domain-containing protein [Boletus coccyginus]|nr:GMC oxidoreductase-domain-containing protein [Boletus coccyginus]